MICFHSESTTFFVRSQKIELSWNETVAMPKREESLLLQCTQCSELYAGSSTNDDELIPDGAASGGATSAAITSSNK